MESRKENRDDDKMLRMIADNYPSYFSVVENDWTVGYTGGKEFAKLGMNPNDFIGLKLEDVFGDHTPFIKEQYLKAFNGEEVTFELFHNDQYQLYHVTPLPDENGAIKRVLAVVENITDRKQSEESLRKSEEKYRLLFNTMLDGFALHEMIYDDHGNPIDYTFLEINPAFEKMTGLRADTVIGMNILDVLPDTEPYWIISYGNVAATGEAIRFENYSRELKKWFEVFAYSPGPGKFATIFIDITERKEAEEALRESEERFRQLAENINEVLYLFDPIDDRFLYVSPAFETMWQIPLDEIYEDPLVFTYAVHPDDQPAFFEAVRKEQEEQVYFNLVFRIVRKDSSTRWIWSRNFPVYDDKGEVYRVVGIADDITDVKKAEEIAITSQKMAGIGALAAGMAHEINSPLQIITGISERLSRQISGDQIEKNQFLADVNNIEKNSWRIANIVRSLLTYSRPSVDQLERCDINTIVEDTLLLIEHQLRSWSNITIQKDFVEDLPLIHCDGNSITQVLINLITNGADAMPDGGWITIHTGYDPEKEQLVIKVSDTGSGIPEEIQAKIFDPFFTTKEIGQGTGLGLSIVHGIIQAHQGEINVSSSTNNGTTFTIHLPKETPLTPTFKEKDLPLGRFDEG